MRKQFVEERRTPENSLVITEEQQKKLEAFRKKGRRVLKIGFGAVFVMLIILYSAYFYVTTHDPTREMWYYPPTTSEIKTQTGATYQVENTFPSYDHYDFLHEKKVINYKTAQDLLGEKFDIKKFRDNYEFSVMRKSNNDPSIKYGISRYYIYGMVDNVNAICTLYVNAKGIVVGLSSPYFLNADFKDMTLNGAVFAEVTRLSQFMLDSDKESTSFSEVQPTVYVATSYGKKKRTGFNNSFKPIYVATIYSKKPIDSILKLIDFYTDSENFANAYVSTFIDKDTYDMYLILRDKK
jgi:hypothetical protein